MPNARSRAVKLVLRMNDEQDFQGLDDLRVRLVAVRVSSLGVHHEEEVLNEAEIFARVDNFLADSMPVASGGDGGCTTQHPEDMLVALLRVLVDLRTNVRRIRLWVEATQSSDQRRQHTHGVRIRPERLDERLQPVVVVAVLLHLLRESIELALGRQLAVDDEEGDFLERGVLC